MENRGGVPQKKTIRLLALSVNKIAGNADCGNHQSKKAAFRSICFLVFRYLQKHWFLCLIYHINHFGKKPRERKPIIERETSSELLNYHLTEQHFIDHIRILRIGLELACNGG